jgi:hypothetical protein
MPDPEKLVSLLNRAVELTRATPGRRGRMIELTDVDEVLVAGDMHGNIPAFQAIYKLADLGKNPRRHLVLQELIHSPFRYPNGGDKSHQLIDLFSALKNAHPRQVHYLIGNHEMSQWTNRKVMKNDEDYNEMFVEGVIAAYGKRADEIYQLYLELFGVLPLALRTPNRILLSHSLPNAKYVPNFKFSDLEPDDLPIEAYNPGGVAYTLVWGRDTSQNHVERFLQQIDSDWLITGHIPCEEGFSVPNDRQIILDCATSPMGYCLIPTNRPLTREEFVGTIRTA